MQSRGDASSEAFAPFCSTCSVASCRNVTSSTCAISTVSELRMAPTASPLNFALVVSSTWKIRLCQVRQLARFEIFTANDERCNDERPLAFSLSLFDLLSPPFCISSFSFFYVLLCHLPSPFAPSTRSNKYAVNWPRNLLLRQRINNRI